MGMVLENFIKNFPVILTNVVEEEAIMILGVNKEIQTLLQKITSFQSLLGDAEDRKFAEPCIDQWLSELKDVMYDAEDTIDDCQIEGAKLLESQNHNSKTTMVCCNFSSAFSSLTNISLRHDMRNRIKELNDRLDRIYKNRKHFQFQEYKKSKITEVDIRQTSSLLDPLVVGREVDVATNELVNLLITEKVERKCRVFAITGMEGVGKTTLAQKIFNHHEIENYFNVKVWACVTQTYSEIDLLKLIITEAKGSYGDANTKSELHSILRDSVASCQSFFLVLDDVWMANVWVDRLRVPLYNANVSVRVLVTTRDENVAKEMKVAHTHPVKKLSIETSWDMLCRLLFSDGEEKLAYQLKELGFMILEKCEGHPLTIKFVARALRKKGFTDKAWENVLGSISNLLQECAIK